MCTSSHNPLSDISRKFDADKLRKLAETTHQTKTAWTAKAPISRKLATPEASPRKLSTPNN
ncbi:MAG: hypothetical protein HQL69_23280 [Magnetococcales bacterium]|nr:hypothetical protein [Magnetococcales bacterium]